MAISAIGPSAEQAIVEIASAVSNRLIDGLQQSEQIASGDLETSIEPTFSIYSDRMTVDVMMAKYARFVDEGRKPGKPPPRSAIEKWLTYPNVKDRMGIRNAMTDKETASLATLIARKIGREGTKGNHFITNVMRDSKLWDDMASTLATGAMNDILADIDALLPYKVG